MNVGQLIKQLQKLNPNLPVCVSKENAVEEIGGIDAPYYGPYFSVYSGPKMIYRCSRVHGSFVLLGEWGDFIDSDKYEELEDGGMDASKIFDSSKIDNYK